ncbi:MAG: dephospho-CoA kinase [Lachnospiraceae bacterium]|nr:dephospho-CoA kinase [Lachnospiraceae bacterium]MDD3659153.1 dephospho-CoA kinase [Lachnospiraceae bacterium]
MLERTGTMQNKTRLKTIGITGGIGAGKSQILDYLEQTYNCKVIKADEIANQMKEPGCKEYEEIVTSLGSGILNENGRIDNQKMAVLLFSDRNLLIKTEGILHPAVKNYIIEQITTETQKGGLDFLFVEAALLIEEHYDEILDELWYIYADQNIRRTRLKKSRGYSDEKITKIMSEQLSDEFFRRTCKVTIDNSGEFDMTCKQIDQILGDYLCQN